MSTNNKFSICSFRTILSILAIVIMIPLALYNTDSSDISFYVTVSVFVLGKYVDLVEKVLDRPSRLYHFVYMLGIVIGILAVAMCFFAFVGITLILSVKMIYDNALIVLTMFFCFIDIAEFIYYVCRLNYTKKLLYQY